jgi:hypothetical protein
MLFTGTVATAAHVGFVAGRYRNGALSDSWTEVERCAEGTFTAFVAACECGWHGPTHRADDRGAEACRRDWVHGHAAAFGAGLSPASALPARG